MTKTTFKSDFMRILSDINPAPDKETRRLVLCSGKIAYDLIEARDALVAPMWDEHERAFDEALKGEQLRDLEDLYYRTDGDRGFARAEGGELSLDEIGELAAAVGPDDLIVGVGDGADAATQGGDVALDGLALLARQRDDRADRRRHLAGVPDLRRPHPEGLPALPAGPPCLRARDARTTPRAIPRLRQDPRRPLVESADRAMTTQLRTSCILRYVVRGVPRGIVGRCEGHARCVVFGA